MSNYPRDEFDRVPESSSRQGVHRARLEPPKNGGLALVIIVGLIVLLIGAVFFFFPKLGQSGGSESAATGTETSQEADAGGQGAGDGQTDGAASAEAASDDDSPAAETTDAADGTDSAAASTEAAAGTQSPTSEAEEATVNKSTGVVVLNSTNVPGMAANASNRVGAEGWPVTFTGNWSGQPQPSSVIFYNGEEQLPNAQALAGTLGINRLVNTSTLDQPLTVVLGPGFG